MKFITRTLLFLFLLTGASALSAQCVNWKGSPQMAEAEDAHVNYRNFVKDKTHEELMAMPDADWQTAYENWQIAYGIAPAADGGRPFHYRDGRGFNRVLMSKETDAAKKAEYATRLISFYDEELECYPKGTESFLYGRKGYDQFYLQGYTMDALKSLDMAIDKGGDKTEYIVLVPMGELVKYFFKEGKIDKVQARAYHAKAMKLADDNIESNETYGVYYKSGKENFEASLREIEDQIFDCDYFVENLYPEFEKNQEDMEVVKYVLDKLKAQGCDASNAKLSVVQAKYDALYADRAEEYEAERRRLNPAYDAKLMIDEGNYSGAINRYQEAAEGEEDAEKKSNYYYQMATVQSGKMNSNSSARSSANRALKANPNNGKAYIMLGDIYGRMGRNCGDSWAQRLAILAAIDKYRQAKSVDSTVAGDANKRINNYSSSLPLREEGFQRNVNPGDKVKVGCGIGETVTVRFQ